jgi:DNA gyrase/topoisomerase IV subunit B
MLQDPTLVVRALVLYALAEHQTGAANTVTVQLNGSQFSVTDNGRGHAIDRSVADRPYLDLIYSHFALAQMSSPVPPVQLHGIGMSLLNCLCRTLMVRVTKPDRTLVREYANGELVAQRLSEVQSSATGVSVSGTLALESAPSQAQRDGLRAWLLAVAASHPRLHLQYNDKSLSPASENDA